MEVWNFMVSVVAFPVEKVVLVAQQLLSGLRLVAVLTGLGVRQLALDGGELFFEVVGLALPVVGGAEVRPTGLEGRVMPAPRQPTKETRPKRLSENLKPV